MRWAFLLLLGLWGCLDAEAGPRGHDRRSARAPAVDGGSIDATPDTGIPPDSGGQEDATFPDADPPDTGGEEDATFPDADPPDSGGQEDAAPDAGFPDGGEFLVVLATGASYRDPGSTQGPAYYTTPYRCAGDAGCAFRVVAGAVAEAVETETNIRPQVGSIQQAARETQQSLIMIDRGFAGTAVGDYDLTGMLSDLDVAAAWAAARDGTICPVLLSDLSACYADAVAGNPWSTCQSALEAVQGTFETRMALRTSGPTAGWSAGCSSLQLMINQGTAQGWGPSGLARHPYTASIVSYAAAADVHLGYQLYTMTTGADDLHPDQAGGQVIADLEGAAWAKVLEGESADGPMLVGVTVTGASSLALSFAVPCLARSSCANDPPITIDTTTIVPQESALVDTYGLHFYSSGALQTPPAIASATPAACSTSPCTVDVTFASPLPSAFDSVSYADTAVVNTAVDPSNPGAGGGNFTIELNPLVATCGVSTPCAEWTIGNVVTGLAPYDSGVPPDSGADAGLDSGADSGADSGVSDTGADAGSIANTQFVDLAPSANYSVAASDTTLTNLQSICVGGWFRRGNVDASSFVSQWRVGGGNLRLWLGVLDTGTPSFGVAFGVGRDFSGTLANGSRAHLVACFQQGTGAGGAINLWQDGAAANGTINGPIPDNLDTTTLDDLWISEEAVNDSEQDDVFFLTSTGSDMLLTTTQVERIFCLTRQATDPDLAATCATAHPTVNLSDVCFLAGLWGYFPFEGSNTAQCGSMSLSTTGTPVFTSY